MLGYKFYIDGFLFLEIYWEYDIMVIIVIGEVKELIKIKMVMDFLFGVEVSKYIGNFVVVK